jgi:bifunctional DNA-binding transcriptional regulator/antitoxin component of YhaV-PrlF toxin-antitoxin module
LETGNAGRLFDVAAALDATPMTHCHPGVYIGSVNSCGCPTIPAAPREKFGLEPGNNLALASDGGKIMLKRVGRPQAMAGTRTFNDIRMLELVPPSQPITRDPCKNTKTPLMWADHHSRGDSCTRYPKRSPSCWAFL